MRVIGFSTKKSMGFPIGSFYFREEGKNLGPLDMRLPFVYTSKYPIPDKRLEHILWNITKMAEDDMLSRDGTNERLAMQKRPYNSVRSNVTIISTENLEDLMSSKENRLHFRKNALGYSDWLNLEFDWTQDVILHQEIIELLKIQRRSHDLLREFEDGYLFKFRNDILIKEQGFRNGVYSTDDIEEAKKKFNSTLREVRKAFRSEYANLPDRVITDLEQLQEYYVNALPLADRYAGQIGIDFRNLQFNVSLQDYNPLQFRFSERCREDTRIVDFDIETTGYKGSKYNQSGIDPRICLVSISREDGITPSEGIDIGSMMISKIANLNRIVVGYLPIGDTCIITNDKGMRWAYVKTEDSNDTRRTASSIIRAMDASPLSGQNIMGYDLSRCLNPNCDPELIRDQKKEIREKFRISDGMFLLGPDNSCPKYLGTGRGQNSYTWIGSILDTLSFFRNYLSPICKDFKLETMGRALDFFLDLGIGFEKSMHGYTELEDIIHSAEMGDSDAGSAAALYAAEDDMAQARIVDAAKGITKDISDCLHLPFSFVGRAGPGRIASVFWNREFYQKRGIVRSVFDLKRYEDFDIPAAKEKAFDYAVRRTGIGYEIEKGFFKDVEVYFTPYITECSLQAIRESPMLSSLYSGMVSTDNVIKKMILQRVLDEICVHVIIDDVSAKKGEIYDSELFWRYGLNKGQSKSNADYFFEEYKKRMDSIVGCIDGKIINHTGNLIFVKGGSREPMENEHFIHMGTADVISIAKGRVSYAFRKEGRMQVASTGFRQMSIKKRFTTDRIRQGFEPNFYDELIYDISDAFFSRDPDKARRIVHDKITGLEGLSVENFFMTARAGYDPEDYSMIYRGTKRFAIQDMLGLRRGESCVFVVESKDGFYLDLTKVNIDDTGSWANLDPYVPFYEMWALQKEKGLYKLCKALGIEDIFEELKLQ